MTSLVAFAKQNLARLLDGNDWYALYSLRKHGYLFEMGWFESYRRKAVVDRAGTPIPWITYPSLSFLEGRIGKDLAVFEWGSGNSTLWWADRVMRVVSCEHDKAWYEKVRNLLPTNAEVSHIPLTGGREYASAILDYVDAFDIVVIDGRDRVNCARNVLPALKPGGVIVWDNSDRSSYQDGYDFLVGSGFRRIDFFGPGPVNLYSWSTSIFYRDGNCLGL